MSNEALQLASTFDAQDMRYKKVAEKKAVAVFVNEFRGTVYRHAREIYQDNDGWKPGKGMSWNVRDDELYMAALRELVGVMPKPAVSPTGRKLNVK